MSDTFEPAEASVTVDSIGQTTAEDAALSLIEWIQQGEDEIYVHVQDDTGRLVTVVVFGGTATIAGRSW